jgi:ActR/RegA family two-component response regulator
MTEHPELAEAVVDLRLGAESALPIWRRLIRRNLSFVVHTGYAPDAIRLRLPSIPIVQKPATGQEITTALSFAFSTALEPQLDYAL